MQSVEDLQRLPLPGSKGLPAAHLSDVVRIERSYQAPPTFLNFLTYRDSSGKWQKGPAITVTANMRPGRQIAGFAKAVDANLGGCGKASSA